MAFAAHPACDGTSGESFRVECARRIALHHDVLAHRAIDTKVLMHKVACGEAAVFVFMREGAPCAMASARSRAACASAESGANARASGAKRARSALTRSPI